MTEAFKSFCKDRELILNPEKTKLLIFNKKGRDRKENGSGEERRSRR